MIDMWQFGGQLAGGLQEHSTLMHKVDVFPKVMNACETLELIRHVLYQWKTSTN